MTLYASFSTTSDGKTWSSAARRPTRLYGRCSLRYGYLSRVPTATLKPGKPGILLNQGRENAWNFILKGKTMNLP